MENKKKKLRIVFEGIGIVFLCAVFFVIYFYVSPKEHICVLKQEYGNYTNTIKVRIIKKEANVLETFASKDKNILSYVEEKKKKEGYHAIVKDDKLVSTKVVSGKKLRDSYLDAGYACDGEQRKKKVSFSLKDGKDTLEVKASYESELEKATIDKKDVSKKVELDRSIDSSTLGDYVVDYSLKISSYRVEHLYKVIHVVDTTAPTMILRDSSKIYVNRGEEFHDPGVEVSDNYDYKANIKISVEGEVDSNTCGEYILTYTVEDSSHNKTSLTRTVVVKEKETGKDGFTYIQGVLIVNKKYSLPKDYHPGLLPEVESAYNNLAVAAKHAGYDIPLISGFRSYEYQEQIYNNYVSIYGQQATDTFSAKPGHSEHQSGLAMDVGKIDDNYGSTPEGKWLSENAHKYGFIIRYQKGKEAITGYKYEPWHIRYLGVDLATKVYTSGLCLEEYLKIS